MYEYAYRNDDEIVFYFDACGNMYAASEDALFDLDSIDLKVEKSYIKNRIKYYKDKFLQISNITILDPGIGNKVEHALKNECYQEAILEIVKRYQGSLRKVK